LPLGEYVYRAVKNHSWVNRKGEPKLPAFRRRWQYDDDGNAREHWDEAGLSFGLTPEQACAGLTENFGVMKFSVAKLQGRGFEFDEPTADGHVNCTNVPFYRPEDIEAANRNTESMRECCEEVLPPVKPPE
jgi:hypothetical protein